MLMKFKNRLLQNHWANFNQTWHNASLSEETQGFTNKDNSILKKEINGCFLSLSMLWYNQSSSQMCLTLIKTGFSGERCGPLASCYKKESFRYIKWWTSYNEVLTRYIKTCTSYNKGFVWYININLINLLDFVCLGFFVPLENFHSFGHVTIAGGQQILT